MVVGRGGLTLHTLMLNFCLSFPPSTLQMESWLGNRKRILVLNREDMISNADRNVWAAYYARQGIKVILSNGKHGMVSDKTLTACSFTSISSLPTKSGF